MSGPRPSGPRPPAARDPGMERGGWTGRPASVSAPSAGPSWRGWLVAVACAVGLAFALPRALAYDAVVDQNLVLKTKLEQIDRTMDEVDRYLERLRVFDAQLRSLSEADGPHGPLPEGVPMQGDVLDYYEDLEDDASMLELPGVTSDEVLGPDPLGPDTLRPADAWARDISDRVSTFVDQYSASEAELAALMSDLEALRAVKAALPGDWPTVGDISSGFGWRHDPFRRYTKFHSGVDIANDPGTLITVVADGVVLRAEYTSGYGNVVDVDHGFGIVTRYAHCKELLVHAAERVQRGDPLALMGSTGRSTGPHLHFELRIDGNAQDPLKYLPR